MVQGQSKSYLGKAAVQLGAGQVTALGSGHLGGDSQRVRQTSLQHGLELQDLHCVMLVVFVAGLDDGAALLCVLNQVIPVLVLLETKREKQLCPKEPRSCLRSVRFRL